MSDAPLKECSKCKGKLKKLVSHSSFHLKGSGWYVTDYGSSKSGSKNNPGKSPAKPENKVSKKASKKKIDSKK
jgi:predicted nucleic acid-binding Zn ribbon protein